MTFPTLSATDHRTGQSLGDIPSTVDPIDLHILSGMTDATMEDHSATPKNIDPRTGGALPPIPRMMDHGPMHNMYTPNFAYPPMALTPYPGNGSIGAYATPNGHNPQPIHHPHQKLESISDLLSSSSDFEHHPELDAIVDAGKCQDCLQFGMHILMPGNRAKFMRTTSAHSNAIRESSRAEIDKLTKEALMAFKHIKEPRGALQSNQKLTESMKDERDSARKELENLAAEYRVLSRRVRDLEQESTAAPHRRSNSPTRSSRHSSSPRPGHRQMNAPYDRMHPNRAGRATNKRRPASPPIIINPDSKEEVILASLATNIRSSRMHPEQPCYYLKRPCPVADYRWTADSGYEVVGLPGTLAGTHYLPNDLGINWRTLENDATTIDEEYRRIDLLFRNRDEGLWRAAARSTFEFRRSGCRLHYGGLCRSLYL